MLGGRETRASVARPALEAAILGADPAAIDPKAAELLLACTNLADMARAALEYQIRINEVILGYPIR